MKTTMIAETRESEMNTRKMLARAIAEVKVDKLVLESIDFASSDMV